MGYADAGDDQPREEGEYVDLANGRDNLYETVRLLRDQVHSLSNENRQLRRKLTRQHELLSKLSNLVSDANNLSVRLTDLKYKFRRNVD